MTSPPGDDERPQDPYQQPYGQQPPGQPHDQPYGQPPPTQPYGQQPGYGQPGAQPPGYWWQAQQPPEPPDSEQQYGAPLVYGGQPGYPYQPARPTDGRALAAMIVGIVSLVLTCGYGVGLLGSPVALVLGKSAMNRIDASNGQLDGRGMAMAGFVLGIIGTVLLVVLVVGAIALAAGLVIFSRSSSL